MALSDKAPSECRYDIIEEKENNSPISNNLLDDDGNAISPWQTNAFVRRFAMFFFYLMVFYSSGGPYFTANVLQELGLVSPWLKTECNVIDKNSNENDNGPEFYTLQKGDQQVSCKWAQYDYFYEPVLWKLLFPFSGPNPFFQGVWSEDFVKSDNFHSSSNEDGSNEKSKNEENSNSNSYTRFFPLYFGGYDFLTNALVPYLLAFFSECLIINYLKLPVTDDVRCRNPENANTRFRKFPNPPTLAGSLVNLGQGTILFLSSQILFIAYKTPFYDKVFDNLRITDFWMDLQDNKAPWQLSNSSFETNGLTLVPTADHSAHYMFLGFILCLLTADFLFYNWHRQSHNISWLWCAHYLHHSTEEYNIAVTMREASYLAEAMIPLQYMLLVLAMAILGFPQPFMMACAMNDTLLFLSNMNQLHTELSDSNPWWELVFMSASLHRVHHSTNLRCLSKNFGSMFVIWDRLCGTYEPENLHTLKDFSTKADEKTEPLLPQNSTANSNTVAAVQNELNKGEEAYGVLSENTNSDSTLPKDKNGIVLTLPPAKPLHPVLLYINNSQWYGRRKEISKVDDYIPNKKGVVPPCNDWDLCNANWEPWKNMFDKQTKWHREWSEKVKRERSGSEENVSASNRSNSTPSNENSSQKDARNSQTSTSTRASGSNQNTSGGNVEILSSSSASPKNNLLPLPSTNGGRASTVVAEKGSYADLLNETDEKLNSKDENGPSSSSSSKLPDSEKYKQHFAKVGAYQGWIANSNLPPLFKAMFTKWTPVGGKCPPLSNKSKINNTSIFRGTVLNAPWKWYAVFQFTTYFVLALVLIQKTGFMKVNLINYYKSYCYSESECKNYVNADDAWWFSADDVTHFKSTVNLWALFTNMEVFLGFALDIAVLMFGFLTLKALSKQLMATEFEKEYRSARLNTFDTTNSLEKKMSQGTETSDASNSITASESSTDLFLLKLETVRHLIMMLVLFVTLNILNVDVASNVQTATDYKTPMIYLGFNLTLLAACVICTRYTRWGRDSMVNRIRMKKGLKAE